MSGRVPTALILGVMLLAARGALGREEPPTRVETARWAARINATSPKGREWMDRNLATVGRLVAPVFDRCLPEAGDEITAFSLFVRLSRKGRVQEIVTDLDASLGTCMTAGARKLELPEAPRDDFWIQVNLAAGL